MDHWFKKKSSYIHTSRLMVFFTAIAILIAGSIPLTSSAAESAPIHLYDAHVSTSAVRETAVPTQLPQRVWSPDEIRFFTILAVNGQQYNYGDPAPAMYAFKKVAKMRGWTKAERLSWRTAVQDIMRFESGFCPNVLGGAVIGNTQGCVLARQGSRSDSGFGQLISIHYIPASAYGSGWLCYQEKLCSKWDIIASPWNSMTALVALIERSGVQPWCYNSEARRIHWVTCSNPGYDV